MTSPIAQDKPVHEPALADDSEKIILFKGQSQYDVVRIFIDDLAEGFRELGHNVIIVDLTEGDAIQQIGRIDGVAKCFVSFNGIGTGLEFDGKPLFDYLNIPLVGWHVDHPFYIQDRLTYPMLRSVTVVSNENNYQFYLKHYRQRGAISKCLQIAGRQYVPEFVPYDKRDKDIVFFGSCLGSLEAQAQYLNVKNKRIQELIWETIEAAKFEQTKELADLFYENIRHLGLDPEELSQKSLQYFLSNMDVYVRIFRRRHVLNALKDFPIHIHGNGWENFDGNTDNKFTFHNSVNFPQTLEIMSKSKLTLNVMPNNRTGIHDRIAYGMHQGAVCLSDSTPGMLQDLEHDKHVLFYQMAANLPEVLPVQAREAIANPTHLEEIGRQAIVRAQERFSWSDRARDILELVETHNASIVLSYNHKP